jgi:hypothetical protein
MGRFETKCLIAEKNLSAVADLSGQWIDRIHGRRPPCGISLDMDSSVIPPHGEQENSSRNGHYYCTCYHPLFVFRQFADLPRNRDGWTARFRVHRFDQICREHGIEHRLTKPNHPWTNGQVERMNRTIKEATVKCYHYDSHDELRTHLSNFVDAYSFARRLKTLKGLTPYEFICKCWTSEAKKFKLNPHHQIPGLNSLAHPIHLGS